MATSAPTYGFAANQRRAAMNAKSTQDNENHGATSLIVSDDGSIPQYKIYVYNILNMPHVRNLPPNFPSVIIPACLPHQKYAFTTLPSYVRNKFNRPQTFEYYYQMEDGRKSASQLLNPACFPGINWDRQLVPNNASMDEQIGNNLNEFGVFWSLTPPGEPEKLDKEIELFRAVVTGTMKRLVTRANELASDPKSAYLISKRMHFAMDYLKLRAPWHNSVSPMINCPTCGEEVLQGIAVHRNSMGDRCIVDLEKAQKMGIVTPPEFSRTEEAQAPTVVSSDPFEAHELDPPMPGTPQREEEDAILRAATRIIEKRQQNAAAKRKATIAARKNALQKDPSANSADVAAAVDSADAVEGEGKE